jgi:hypothetical protein
MTSPPISNPSFPPVDDLVDLVRSIDRERALQNFKRGLALASNCLIWTAALTVIAVQQGRKLLPHLASWLRALADVIDPDSAPLTPPMTARDIPTLEFFKDRMQRPAVQLPSQEELAVPDDLASLNKVELMKLAGVKSRRLNKEQLIHRIMEQRKS